MTATTMNSIPVPSPGETCTPPSRTRPSVPSSQPAAAVAKNSVTVVARTGTPSSRAAVRAPPVANTALPKRVRHSTHAATAVTPSHHSSEIRNRPSPICTVEPKTASADPHPEARARPSIRADPVTVCGPADRTPCRTRNVARVTRKLGRTVLTTSSPLTTTTSSAQASETTSAGQVPHPACPMSSAATRELATETTPTERSNWPAISSSATATPPMPSSEATSRTLARPPAVSSSGACRPKNRTTATSPTSAARLGRASALASSRRPAGTVAGAGPNAGTWSVVTGAAGRSGDGTSAAGPPEADRVRSSVHDARPGRDDRRSRLQAPADPVVGVPGPAGHLPGIGDPVADHPGRVAGHLHGPALRPAHRAQRKGHHPDGDRVHRRPVRADVEPGQRPVGDLQVVVVGLQTQPAAERAPAVGPRLDPAVVQQHAAVVVPDERQLPLHAGADAERAGQAGRGVVAGGFPGDRHLGGAAGLQQRGEHAAQRRDRPANQDPGARRRPRDPGAEGRRAGVPTPPGHPHHGAAGTLPPASRARPVSSYEGIAEADAGCRADRCPVG